jgi:NodT family efflux transporter outer membrane factor (OMF) lipoprotein
MSHTHTARLGFAATAIAIFLAGCAVGPDYKAPDVVPGANFLGEAGKGRPASAPNALDTWWKTFQDPVLDGLVNQALVNNLDLARARAAISQAGAASAGASAALLPSGQLSATAARARRSLDDPNVATQSLVLPEFNRYGNHFEAGAGVGWEIDLFGGLSRGAEAAAAEYDGAQATGAAVRLEIVAGITNAYTLTRALQARLEVARKRVDTAHQTVTLVKLLADRGLVADWQFREAESGLALSKSVVPQLEAGLASARYAIDVLLARQPGTLDPQLDAFGPMPSPPELKSASGPADLLRRRPDLLVAERRLAASNAQIGQAISEYYPKVSLSGLLGFNTFRMGNALDDNASQGAGALGIRWRLFDFGRVDAQVEAAKGRNAAALANYRLAVLRATAEVEDAFTAKVKQEQRLSDVTDGEVAVEKALASARKSASAGNSSRLDVLAVEQRLYTTQDARILAKLDSTLASVASFKALGGGWNVDAPLRDAIASVR